MKLTAFLSLGSDGGWVLRHANAFSHLMRTFQIHDLHSIKEKSKVAASKTTIILCELNFLLQITVLHTSN